jgi:hypothetical protein
VCHKHMLNPDTRHTFLAGGHDGPGAAAGRGAELRAVSHCSVAAAARHITADRAACRCRDSDAQLCAAQPASCPCKETTVVSGYIVDHSTFGVEGLMSMSAKWAYGNLRTQTEWQHEMKLVLVSRCARRQPAVQTCSTEVLKVHLWQMLPKTVDLMHLTALLC